MNKHESCCVLVTGVRNFVVCLHFQFLIINIYNAIQNPADGYVFLCVRFVLCADVYFMSEYTYIYFQYFTCMGILLARLCTQFMQSLLWPEEGAGCPRIGVADGCELLSGC